MSKKGIAITIIVLVSLGTTIGIMYLIWDNRRRSLVNQFSVLAVFGFLLFRECPTISGVPDQNQVSPWDLYIDPYVDDKDTPVNNLRYYTNSSYAIWVENATGSYIHFECSLVLPYSEKVKITVSDGRCSASQTINVTYN